MRDTSAGPRNCFPHQSRPSMSATESHLYQPHRSNAQVRDAALRWPVDSSNLTCRPETVRRPFPSFRIRRGRALVHARYAPIQHLPWRARGASTLVSIDRRSTPSMPVSAICILATASLISRALREIPVTAWFQTPRRKCRIDWRRLNSLSHPGRGNKGLSSTAENHAATLHLQEQL